MEWDGKKYSIFRMFCCVEMVLPACLRGDFIRESGLRVACVRDELTLTTVTLSQSDLFKHWVEKTPLSSAQCVTTILSNTWCVVSSTGVFTVLG